MMSRSAKKNFEKPGRGEYGFIFLFSKIFFSFFP